VKITTYIITFLIVVLPHKDRPYKNGRPTSRGIDYYVMDQTDSLIRAYQLFIRDTLDYVEINTDDLTEYTDYDSLELGRYYIPNEILISNQSSKFIAYEIKELSKFRKKTETSNKFVCSTIMHEMTHHYFYHIMQQMKFKKIHVSPEYAVTLRVYPYNNTYSADFIEEGVCEYMTQKMGEINQYKNIHHPKNTTEILDAKNKYEIKYKYSSFFVKAFLDSAIEKGRVRDGIEILLKNIPPTYKEIITPELYFNRLIY
jgi:hypothetical protein